MLFIAFYRTHQTDLEGLRPWPGAFSSSLFFPRVLLRGFK